MSSRKFRCGPNEQQSSISGEGGSAKSATGRLDGGAPQKVRSLIRPFRSTTRVAFPTCHASDLPQPLTSQLMKPMQTTELETQTCCGSSNFLLASAGSEVWCSLSSFIGETDCILRGCSGYHSPSRCVSWIYCMIMHDVRTPSAGTWIAVCAVDGFTGWCCVSLHLIHLPKP